MAPNKEANSLNSSPAGLICLPPISEELQLVWTQAAQTSELDGNEHLLQTFSYFPYPSLADIALLCLRYGLQMEKVKTWFMAQRLRCGISWSSEEIEETRARVAYHRDQLHFKSLLSFTHAGRPPEEVPSALPPPEQAGTSVSLAFSKSTQIRGVKVQSNGGAATSKPQQPPGSLPQPLSSSESALSSQQEPAWPQRLRHNNSAASRGGPAEYLSQDMQRQRKTKRKTKEQLAILKSFFLQCQWARREDYHKLEQITGLPRPEIIQWFGDTRYALKHGQLKWFRDNAVPGAPSFQDLAIPTPPPSARSLNEWDTPPLPNPPPPPDIHPLERYWATHQQLQENDIPQLSQASRLSTQQVLDWFDSRLPEPAEVVVCLDEEEEEEEEELLEDEDEEEEEEEDDDDDDVVIQD